LSHNVLVQLTHDFAGSKLVEGDLFFFGGLRQINGQLIDSGYFLAILQEDYKFKTRPDFIHGAGLHIHQPHFEAVLPDYIL